jgi:copper oxidase (laccase) domain-containing protein
LGPSIAGHHYPVGPEVEDAFRQAFGAEAEAHLSNGGDATHLDLTSANLQLLRDEGVDQVEISGLCTACRTEDWFSHRGEHGSTGRFGAILALSG